MNLTAPRISLLLLLVASPSAAQYTRPGELGETRPTVKQRVTQAAQNARWQLGPIDIAPRLAISDIGYVSNIYFSAEQEAVSDLKAQGSAELRGFFNLGPKVLVSPYADLTYAWWQEQTELRSSNESFGLQLFGDLNRLQLELEAESVQMQRDLNSELRVPVDEQDDRLLMRFDVDFWGPLSLFGSAQQSELRYRGKAAEEKVQGLVLSNLDVDNELLRGGIAYELSNGLRIGVGLARTESTYLIDPDGRSNRGTGPLLNLAFAGSRLNLRLEAASRDIEFDGRDSNEDRRQTDSEAQLRWSFTEKLSATLYNGVQLSASALDSGAVFESLRSGISMQQSRRSGTQVGFFYEVGEDEYSSVASDQVDRLDDIRSYGVSVRFKLTPRLGIQLGYTDTRRDSSAPDLDRDLRAFTGSLSLGSDLLTW